MAGHRDFDVLRNRMSPRRRQKNRRAAERELKKMLLSELRKAAGITQVRLANAMGITQPTLSRLESQQDIQVSTLRRLVEALGGELEIIALLPKGQMALSQFTARNKAG